MTRLRLLFVALLACGFLASGCGDDETTDEQSDAPDTVETAPTDAPVETTETTPEAADPGAVEQDDAVGEQAVEACKSAIGDVSNDIRGDLEEICEKVREGDPDDVREATVEICKTIVRDSVPDGAARDQALESCDRAAP